MTKSVYRVRNWKDYNESLVQRGSLSFWIDEETVSNWHSERKLAGRGRPEKYSDVAIEAALTLKSLLGLTFRATEGFMRGLIKLAGLEIEAPNYTLLCKRQKHLSVKLPKSMANGCEPVHIVIDSTGLKVYGEGEWKTRQHGVTKKRLWRKLHIALNAKTQEIEVAELTELGGQDWQSFESMLSTLDKSIEKAIGDGAYDRHPCYKLAEEKQFQFIAPPQKNARTSTERRLKLSRAKRAVLGQRDEAIEQIRTNGRTAWKIESGYHQRSLAETVMFRIKMILGNKLNTRLFENQKIEAAIWCKIINKMTMIGMPFSEKVA